MFLACLALLMLPAQSPEERAWEILEQLGRSTETLAFTSVETYESREGTPRDRFVYRFRGCDKSHLQMFRAPRAGAPEELREDVRQDGRRRYAIQFFAGYPNSIEGVVVSNQESTRDRYQGTMSRALWVVMPGGRPPYEHREHGATLRKLDRPEAGSEWVLESTHQGLALRCGLDPEHDWLPRWVELEGKMRIEVESYATKNGRWFIESGVSREPGVEPGTRRNPAIVRFRVVDFAINAPLDDAEFGMPDVPQGAAIVDETTGKESYRGGAEARALLVKKYPPIRPRSEATGTLAVEEVRRSPLWRLALVVSLGLISLGLYKWTKEQGRR